MRIEIVADESALAVRAADLICDVIARKHEAVLGLPTGDTPIATYAELVRRSSAGEADTSGAVAFGVDEFIGVRSYSRGTNAAFFGAHIDDIFFLRRTPESENELPDIAEYADDVRRWGSGGFDLCVLGIGKNGHIAFNEPGSAVDSRARVVDLTEESRRAHAAGFGSLEAVPRRGVTLGIADILESRTILVIAQGAGKAGIVARAIEGSMSADVPASWLREHDDVTWLLDEAAAAGLRHG